MSDRITQSLEIYDRWQFAWLCNVRGLGRALEIGTDRGTFAARFMRRFTGISLTCVDPYTPYHEMNWNRAADFAMAITALAPYSDRARIARASSQEFHAATAPMEHARYPGYTYDFIYLDGDHTYDAVRRDIELWWPRVSSFGILAGHDYSGDHPGVVQAVQEFAEQHDRQVLLTRDLDGPPSWYVYRAETPPDQLFYPQTVETVCTSSE